MDRNQISQLQPLKICNGWSVVQNNLNSEKRMEEKYELLKLQNEKRNAVIKAIFENDQYHVKVAGLKADKIYKEDSFNEMEQLLEELEYQIWTVGSGVLEGLQQLSQHVPNFLRLKIPAGWTVDYITLKDTIRFEYELYLRKSLFEFFYDRRKAVCALAFRRADFQGSGCFSYLICGHFCFFC